MFDLYSDEEGNSLSNKIQNQFKEFIIKQVTCVANIKFLPKLKEYQSNDILLLMEMRKCWESYGLFKKWVSRLFHHHNKKVSVIRQADGRNEHTDAISLSEFRNQIYIELKRRIVASILGVWHNARIHQDREANLDLLASVLLILDEILDQKSMERKEFFEKLAELLFSETEEFYNSKLKEWKTDDCGSYFEWLDAFSKEEEEILAQACQNIDELQTISHELRKIFFNLLLANYKVTLSTSSLGFSYLLANKNFPVSVASSSGDEEDQEAVHVLQGQSRSDLPELQVLHLHGNKRTIHGVHQADQRRDG